MLFFDAVNNEEDAPRTTKILKQLFSFEGENFTGMFFLRLIKNWCLNSTLFMAKRRRKSLVNRR